MSRLSKYLAISLVIVFVLACNFVTQPIKDTQELAGTAQALGTLVPIETLQALPSLIPAETLQALPSVAPTLEAMATQFGGLFNPQGTPVQEWRGIPIMSQATTGQEFPENNTYSFKANVTTKEVQDFYNEKLSALGWKQAMSFPVEAEGGLIFFQKDSNTLTITMAASEGITTVVLTMA
jgi:hypothetical protein